MPYKAKVKLCSAFAIQALKHYLAQGGLSGDGFVNKICAPLKTIEIWDNLMVKRYGPVCKNSVAYGRLKDRLQTQAGLQEITAANTSGVPLHGKGRDTPGIEDCYLLVEAFKRCQAGGLAPPDRIPTGQELEKEEEAKKKIEQEAFEAAKKLKEEAEANELKRRQEEDLECMACTTPGGTSPSGSGTGVSAVPREAEKNNSETLVEQDMSKVFFYDTPDAIKAGMEQPLRTCHRITIVVAAPTSGWTAISAYMNTVQEIVQMFQNGSGDPDGQHRIRIVFLPGSRFDVMGKIQDKLSGTYPSSAWTVMTVQLQQRSTQTWNSKPTYAMVLADKKDLSCGECVSIAFPKTASKTLLAEGLNLRCGNKACSMRPKAPHCFWGRPPF